ncbi:MAG TPA: STAS domain-containing protein [Solirubrobacteraceae bacterium]|nr:STAS domain-containing protein [Solirubrobacteraceae bacterium]
MSVLARITDEHHGNIPVVAIAGEIDASNAEEIAERLRAALSNRSEALVVDLSGTTYIDSAGLNILFELATALRERQQELHLVVAQPSPIARMVAIVGLDAAVPTHRTRAAALDTLR